jgi:hypothetical protein
MIRLRPSLRDLQHQLASLILEPTAARCESLFSLPAGAVLDERLCIYAAGYRARIGEALAESFPALAHLLPSSGWREMVSRYIAARPPLSYNLNDAAACLPDFLRGDKLGAVFPFVADLAELEWRLVRAFHAEGASALDPAEVASVSAEASDLVLRFQPAVAIVESRWPIHALWKASETPIEAIDIEIEARPQVVLIYRVGFEARCELIDEGQGRAIAALLAGRTLGDVVEQMEEADPHHVGQWFARWMGLGLLAGVEVVSRTAA